MADAVSIQSAVEKLEARGANKIAVIPIRAFVQDAKDKNGSAIVILFRVQGFSPYAQVLKGLTYTANETGLVPHKNMTKWIERQIEELKLGF